MAAVNRVADTGTLGPLIQTWRDKIGLERLIPNLVIYPLCEKKPIPKNSGANVIFHRFKSIFGTNYANVSSFKLTESTAPTAAALSAYEVSAALEQYGFTTDISDLAAQTFINDMIKDAIEILGENAAEIIDRRIIEECYGTSAAVPSGAGFAIQYGRDTTTIGTLSALTSAHSMTYNAVVNGVATLRRLNAKPFPDGYFRLIVSPITHSELQKDSTWQAAYQYTDPASLRKGIVGRIGGVEVIETSNILMNASGTGVANTTSAYYNIILANGALGVTEIDGSFKTFVVPAAVLDHSNPLQQWTTVGWKATFTAKRLHASAGRLIVTTDGQNG